MRDLRGQSFFIFMFIFIFCHIAQPVAGWAQDPEACDRSLVPAPLSAEARSLQLLTYSGIGSDSRSVKKFVRDVTDNQWVFFDSVLADHLIQTMKSMGYLASDYHNDHLLTKIRSLKELSGFSEPIRKQIATALYSGLTAEFMVGHSVGDAALNAQLLKLSSERDISVEKLYDLHRFLTAVNDSAEERVFFIEMIQLALPTLAKAIWRYQVIRHIENYVIGAGVIGTAAGASFLLGAMAGRPEMGFFIGAGIGWPLGYGLDRLAGFSVFRYTLWRGQSRLIKDVVHQIKNGQMGARPQETLAAPTSLTPSLPNFLSSVQVPTSLVGQSIAGLKSLGSEFLNIELKLSESISAIHSSIQLEETYLETTGKSIHENRGTGIAYEVGARVLEKRNEVSRLFHTLDEHSETVSAAQDLALTYKQFLQAQSEDQTHSTQMRETLEGRVEFLSGVITNLNAFNVAIERMKSRLDENIAALEQLVRDLSLGATKL